MVNGWRKIGKYKWTKRFQKAPYDSTNIIEVSKGKENWWYERFVNSNLVDRDNFNSKIEALRHAREEMERLN